MIVDDLKVSNSFAFCWSNEMDLRFGFSSSFCVDVEVSGFSNLCTCTGKTGNIKLSHSVRF